MRTPLLRDIQDRDSPVVPDKVRLDLRQVLRSPQDVSTQLCEVQEQRPDQNRVRLAFKHDQKHGDEQNDDDGEDLDSDREPPAHCVLPKVSNDQRVGDGVVLLDEV